jgi:hypothetical protein
VSTITKIKLPESLHDVQKLTGVHDHLEQVHLATQHQGTPFL